MVKYAKSRNCKRQRQTQTQRHTEGCGGVDRVEGWGASWLVVIRLSKPHRRSYVTYVLHSSFLVLGH